MSEPLIAEDLLLLLTHDQKGTVRESSSADFALAGALLAELTLSGRVRITEQGESAHKPGRVVVVDASPTDDALLDGAIAQLVAKPERKPQQAVELLAKKVRRPLQDRLVARGLLRHERTHFIGFNKWPEADGSREQEVRSGLFRVLLQGEEPTVRQAALVALLSALKVADKVIAEDVSTVNKKAIRKRAEEVLEQNWISGATRKAIDAAIAASTATFVAATS